MYSVLKYLVQNAINYQGSNSKLSGGFPHSEIPGSKLILSSPRLIAEYHVLHRLLLPRHPPNALLALDLIQKETDSIEALPRGALLEGSICCELTFFADHLIHRDRISWHAMQSCFWNRSHTFPALPPMPTLPMSVGPAWRGKN